MSAVDPGIVHVAARESERALFGDDRQDADGDDAVGRKCLMVRPVGDPPPEPAADSEFTWERIAGDASWREYEQRRHRVEASRGFSLASTAAVIAAMRAVQRHLPLRWYFMRREGEAVAAVGVLPIDVAGRRFHRLQDVDVFPPHRGQGTGNVLLDFVHTHAARCGASATLLGADMDDWPIDWYRRRGYGSVTTAQKTDGGRTEFGPPEYEKACACVVGDQGLLVFRHPVAGTQLPKGTLDAGEDPATGVLRELEEESGIADGRLASALDPFVRLVASGPLERGPIARHRWHPFIVEVDRPLPRRWDHIAMGSEEEAGLVFRYSWHDLSGGRSRPPDFAPIFIDVIDRVRDHLRSRDRQPFGDTSHDAP